MRIEWGDERLILVGKGWQIRAKLRQLAKHPLTVYDLLQRHALSRSER